MLPKQIRYQTWNSLLDLPTLQKRINKSVLYKFKFYWGRISCIHPQYLIQVYQLGQSFKKQLQFLRPSFLEALLQTSPSELLHLPFDFSWNCELSAPLKIRCLKMGTVNWKPLLNMSSYCLEN